ncbi:response regulator transcription factor [Streptomyces sp. TLI_053]|uniref:helix-turn-helix transcriptional regulator n=1 Tax=Streptomyces sp. TLI_053 TaxID=1855352 RepID=UPI0013520B92|nr:response regulator transcription factor [Streptomyces sp. TLI_053]
MSESEKCADYFSFIEKFNFPDNPIPVAFITGCTIVEHHHRALQAGATGILSRAITTRNLINSVRTLSAGGMVFWPATTWNALEDHLSRPFLPRRTVPNFDTLTPREIDVLVLIGEGLGNERIANLLSLEVGTVKEYVSAVLTKLGAANRTQAAIIAIRSRRFPACVQQPYRGIPRQYRPMNPH